MLRKALNYSSCRSAVILTERFYTSVYSKYCVVKSHNNTSLIQLKFTQTRFCSSNSENVLHKVFFVSAESPPTNVQSNSLADTVEYIPPPPVPPPVPSEIVEASVDVLNKLGEPTFHSLGLGGWTPVGLIQTGIEFLHVSGNLPWWGSIAVATVIMRTLLFPLVIVSQRNAAKMNNYMPIIQKLQLKMTEARNAGNNLEAARLGFELQQTMKKFDIKPMRSILVPLAQAPIFISMFIGLRRCANLPVESMKEGGMLWFTDLTVADPYFLLPVITSLTLFVTMEIGTEGQPLSSNTTKIAKYVLRAIPIIIFPFTLHFPATVLCYWVSTNFCSLLQVGFLRIPKVRSYFKINQLVKHTDINKSKKGFVEGVKESWSNMKVSSEVQDRHRVDEIRFLKAGKAPLVKTYKYNPVKKSNIIDVKAKAKD